MSGVGTAGYLFLLIFCLVLPYLVLKASLRARDAKVPPARSRYFVAVLINQAFFVIIAILVARVEWVDIFACGTIVGKALLLAAGTLVLAVLGVPLRWRFTPDDSGSANTARPARRAISASGSS
jgi:hypothetical protein